jgi:DNA repair protein SbcC/Rad50
MKIRKLRLRNFQSHELTEIDLSKGLNVFVGNSDEGKSAIVRALDAVLRNEVSNDLVRHGADFFEVTIWLDSRIMVSRRKGEKVNEYVITEEDKVAETFERLGNDVPKRVREILGQCDVTVDEEEIPVTIANQEQGTFLMDQPAPVRAKLFGKISGLDVIDRALKEIQSDVYKAERDIRDGEAVLEEYKSKETSLKEELDVIDGPYKELSWRIAALSEKKRKADFLRSKLAAIQAIDRQIRLDSFSLKMSKESLELIDIRMKKVDVLLKRKTLLERAFQDMQSAIQLLKEEAAKKEEAKALQEETLSELKRLKRCPLCGGEISSKQVERMLS